MTEIDLHEVNPERVIVSSEQSEFFNIHPFEKFIVYCLSGSMRVVLINKNDMVPSIIILHPKQYMFVNSDTYYAWKLENAYSSYLFMSNMTKDESSRGTQQLPLDYYGDILWTAQPSSSMEKESS